MNNIIPIKKGSYIPDIEIKGRTLVNLLGRRGNAIYKNWFTSSSNIWGTLTYDQDKFVVEKTDGDLVTNLNTFQLDTGIQIGKYYIALAEASTTEAYDKETKLGGVHLSGANSGQKATGNLKANVFGTIYSAWKAETNTYFEIVSRCKMTVKNIRLYEIDASTFAKVNADPEFTGEKLASRYPYVDDIKCVVNPYIENKENLIDDYQWSLVSATSSDPVSPLVYSENGSFCATFVKLERNSKYTISIENPALYQFSFQLPNGVDLINPEQSPTGINGTRTIMTTEDRTTLVILANEEVPNNIGAKNILESIKNGNIKITLVKGIESKKYEDCHNSRIMFETKLYEGETISRRNDGTYVKNSIIDEIEIDEIDRIQAGPFGSDFSEISIYRYTYPANSTSIDKNDQEAFHMIRYDGKIIKHANSAAEWSIADEMFHFGGVKVNGMCRIHLRIPNLLSGWSANYTPTIEEVRAFFMGWTMYAQSSSAGDQAQWDNSLSSTHRKGWLKLWCGIGDKATSVPIGGTAKAPYIIGSAVFTVPTTLNDSGYTPYRVLYKKPSMALDEVTTHGSLIIDKDSHIDVGSGLIIGEEVISKKNGINQYINLAGENLSNTSNRASKYLKLLKDGEFKQFNTEATVPSTSEIRVGNAGWCNITNEAIQYKYSLDYLIYRPDTVTSFEYNLGPVGTLNDLISKNIESVVDCYNALSKTDSDVDNLHRMMSQISNPNLLMNGDFKINQRGKSEYINNVYQYTVDRWAVNNSQSKIIVKDGYIRAENYQSIFATLGQTVEFTNPSKAKKLTVSFYIRDFVGNPIACNARCYFNSTVSCALGVVEIDTPFKKGYNEFTVNIPDNVKSFTVYFYTGTTDNLASSGNTFFELEWVKAELGSLATPFIPRPFPEELALCHRYYQRCTSIITLVAGANKDLSGFKYTTRMRTIPTVTMYPYTNPFDASYANKIQQWINHSNMISVNSVGTADGISFISAPDKSTIVTTDTYICCYEANSEIY